MRRYTFAPFFWRRPSTGCFAAMIVAGLVGLTSLVAVRAATAADGPPSGQSNPATASLRAAVEHLEREFPERYDDAGEFLARLKRIELRLSNESKASAEDRKAALAELETLRREALLANPLVDGQPILFVVRHQYRSDHHNTATMFQNGEINTGSFQGGGALKTIDLSTGELKTLIELPEGVVRDPEVSFDGRRILVSIRNNKADDYHLYEMQADGSALKQLTFGSEVSDIDPIYLPDGRILFTSTREPKYCMCNRHIMGNLFTISGDGANLQQIGHSTLHEGHPSLLPDGRVIYDRWEYVDRNFGDAQGVWVVNPDGTNHAIHWGNNTNSPGGVIDARAIPGTDLFVATFTSCHDRPWGALAIVDRCRGLDGREPVLRTWPPEAIELVGKGNYDTFKRVRPRYEDPYPLSQEFFLCARTIGKGEQMGLFLVDTFGNEVLLHAEGPGCFDPMPLTPRERPPVIPARIDLSQSEGQFYVQNVYIGSGMERVEPGSVKYLRVVESPEKRFWTKPGWKSPAGAQAPGMAWDDFNNKRILGTVPVAEDGSASFRVPADTFVYFQLLDERGMMVQSMRSGTIVRPGEVVGCVGCHEDRRSTVATDNALAAAYRPPEALQPWHGPARLFSYRAEVQPVFDKHCVSCHDNGRLGAAAIILADDLNLLFNTSYTQLREKGLVRVVGAGPHKVQPPKSWGSGASRLVKVLLEGHGNPVVDDQIELSDEDFDRIVTWIDINAPYYPRYASAYGKNRYGRSPLTDAELGQLAKLSGVRLGHRDFHKVNLTRPELSACLQSKDIPPERRKQALALIRAAAARLAERPRADMPGFRLVDPVEIVQQRRYDELLRIERAMREAIARGQTLAYPTAESSSQPQQFEE